MGDFSVDTNTYAVITPFPRQIQAFCRLREGLVEVNLMYNKYEPAQDRMKGSQMFNRVISTLRHLGGESNFEGYYKQIQRHNLEGSPTFDEAKRDFRDAIAGRYKV